jgi:hypothetical protein
MHQMTTGASNDFERATQIARDMVMRYGMSDALGPMVYAENEGEVFLGRSVTKTTNMSEQTMQKVDVEVRRIIDAQYNLARRLIEENQDKMHSMAKAMSSNSTTSWAVALRVRPRTGRLATLPWVVARATAAPPWRPIPAPAPLKSGQQGHQPGLAPVFLRLFSSAGVT